MQSTWNKETDNNHFLCVMSYNCPFQTLQTMGLSLRTQTKKYALNNLEIQFLILCVTQFHMQSTGNKETDNSLFCV